MDYFRNNLTAALLCGVLCLHAVNGTAESLSMQPGSEVQGQLDNEEKQEESYRLVLTQPRGIYQLSVTTSNGPYPSVSIESEALDEPLYLDSGIMEDGAHEITLPAGEYRIGIANDTRAKSLSYRLMVSLVAPWSETVEWEPNDVTPNQQLREDKPLKGRLVGADEDNFLFSVGTNHQVAYDFVLETTNTEPLLFMVMAYGADTGENQGHCQVGVREGSGYAIRGLALGEWTYVVNAGRAPGGAGTAFSKRKKVPAVNYTLSVVPARKALISLLPDVMVFRAAGTQKGGGYGLQEQLSRRKIVEDDILRLGQKHRNIVVAKDRAVNLTLIKQEFPSSLDEMKKKTMGMIEETVIPAGTTLASHDVVRGACVNYSRKTAYNDEASSRSFARARQQWDLMPDQWAMEIINGAAAKALRKEIDKSQYIISAALLSPFGVVVAATDQPEGLWKGDGEFWKRWRDRGDLRAVSTDPVFDQASGRWLMETGIPVKDGSNLIGVVVFVSVAAK